MAKKKYAFSQHYSEGKGIAEQLAVFCIHHGKKFHERQPGKFRSVLKMRKGELIVIYREDEEAYFVITAFFNQRKGNGPYEGKIAY